jgi:hypothetical protein
MQTHTNIRRRNRVYKSLHKPLTYLGVERTLFYFVCVSAVGAFNLFNSVLAGLTVFIGGYDRTLLPTQAAKRSFGYASAVTVSYSIFDGDCTQLHSISCSQFVATWYRITCILVL